MNWGKWIIVSFVLFAGFIGTLVTICVRQDISLVSKNYYQDELDYQAQLDRQHNTSQLQSKPMISVDGQTLQIFFRNFPEIEQGELVLFSPADARHDRTFRVSPTDGQVAHFNVSKAPKGMYRARLSWKMKGREFYMEQIVHI